MTYVEGAVLVGGYTAAVFGVSLRKLARDGYFDNVHPEARADLLRVIDEFERAARAWQAAQANRRQQENRNAETADAETGAPSSLSTDQVMDLLKVSERRVQQLAPRLAAFKENGRWVYDRAAVLAELERRAG